MSVARDAPPYRRLGALMLVVIAVLGAALFLQFRGAFTASSTVTLLSDRAGLVVERGAKVTFNGVEIGRVAQIVPDRSGARLTLDVDPDVMAVIPANAGAEIRATTVFGNKYISLMSPKIPATQRLSDGSVLQAAAVTTEFNTLFETVTEIAEQVDPVKLNQTLSATAEALHGLGDRFGGSLENGNRILTEFDDLMPQWRADVRSLTALADIYADAAPDLWDGLSAAVTTARTVNARSGDIDAALMAAVGFAEPATSAFERGGPYLIRGAADLLPTSKLLDDYRGMMFCTIRNYAEVAPEITRVLGGDNGYSLRSAGTITGAGNPFVYPDNLPRVNARGGPEGRPGCWQKITRELWPNPYLVMDTGFSLAPYNHVELGQPLLVDYVWGRQVGEHTINP
ncbi:MAG: MCE family protein [Mycobacterium kyogaense]|uniref:MCE family protein n=1 Tax=Mycobacterium kyogaense TaxID=2212479 RepID=UPI002FF5E74F